MRRISRESGGEGCVRRGSESTGNERLLTEVQHMPFFCAEFMPRATGLSTCSRVYRTFILRSASPAY